MTVHERPDDVEKTPLPQADLAAQHRENISGSRRRFTASGIAVSGVLMTLASRSVMGQTTSKSPSGFISGNQSTHGPAPISSGRSPGYWKNHQSSWPVPLSTKFSGVFSCSSTSPYKQFTMLELLTHRPTDTNNLGMHLVAAVLNARMGWTPFLTEERIRSMFTEWQSKGYFSPTANVQWNAAQIVDYLKATQG